MVIGVVFKFNGITDIPVALVSGEPFADTTKPLLDESE